MSSGATPKQFLQIHGRTILEHTLDNFEQHPEIEAIALACLPVWLPWVGSRLRDSGFKKVRWLVPGGSTGQDSIYNALSAMQAAGVDDDRVVLVHDGVRPVITPDLISENIAMVEERGSAVTSVPMWETVGTVDEQGLMSAFIDRSSAYIARAPQGFRFGSLWAAHRAAQDAGRHDYVDSASLMAAHGHELHVVVGGPDNIKVTTSLDFYMLRAILDAREAQQVFG